MKCDEASKMFNWCILIQVNEHVAHVCTAVCVCVCAVIHLLQLVYSTVSRERRRLPWSFLSQMLLRNRWVFFINGWRIAALLATQHTGQPKLCESDNSVTSACCVQAKLFTVCGNGPQQKSHRQAAIGENEMTTERMKNAARDIFQHISSLFFVFALWQYARQEWEKWWTNKKNALITAVIHSFRVLPDLAFCLPLIMPWVLMHFDFFFFFFITRQRPELVGRPKGIGRYLASVVSS